MQVEEYLFEELIEDVDESKNKDFDDIISEREQSSKLDETDKKAENSSHEKQEPIIDKDAIQKEIEGIIEVAKQEALKQAEAIKEQAKKDGFEAGYKEGYENGLKTSQDKLLKTVDEYTKKMEDAVSKLIKTAADIDNSYKELEDSATDAILAIVRKIVSKKIDEDRDIITGMVKEALKMADNAKLKIKLNPEDAENIKERLDEISQNKVVDIVSDDSLSRGSILIEEEDGNVIDAGVDTKMNQLISSIKNE